jgi:hypothetical protein
MFFIDYARLQCAHGPYQGSRKNKITFYPSRLQAIFARSGGVKILKSTLTGNYAGATVSRPCQSGAWIGACNPAFAL